ncbi:MAG: hypothetical protein JWR60_1263 [Polaromonas sp.]|nr:hypothetical protein [Polaromonas sp.]
MEDLRHGELEGLSEGKITLLPLRARVLKFVGYLLLPGTFIAVWLNMWMTRSYSKSQLVWLGVSCALGFAAWTVSMRSDAFCRSCGRLLIKRRASETRNKTEYSGIIVICTHCKTYEKFLRSHD